MQIRRTPIFFMQQSTASSPTVARAGGIENSVIPKVENMRCVGQTFHSPSTHLDLTNGWTSPIFAGPLKWLNVWADSSCTSTLIRIFLSCQRRWKSPCRPTGHADTTNLCGISYKEIYRRAGLPNGKVGSYSVLSEMPTFSNPLEA